MIVQNKNITYSLRFIVGIIFIISAISKINPIEPFEFKLIETGLYSWTYVSYFARAIIGLEFFLGLGLLLNIRPKLINTIAINLLVIFTIYLVWFLYKFGNDGDCGCFGNYFQMSPLNSLYKNIGMVATLIFFKNHSLFNFKITQHKLSLILIALASTSYSYIIDPPAAFFTSQKISVDDNTKLTFNDFGTFDNTHHKADTTLKIICMFSLDCRFCKLGAQKISLIDNNIKEQLPIYYVFGNKAKEKRNERTDTFYIESHSNSKYPVSFMNTKKFLSMTKGQFPVFIILKNNKFKEIVTLDELSHEKIKTITLKK